jgi:hypothetical protein
VRCMPLCSRHDVRKRKLASPVLFLPVILVNATRQGIRHTCFSRYRVATVLSFALLEFAAKMSVLYDFFQDTVESVVLPSTVDKHLYISLFE